MAAKDEKGSFAKNKCDNKITLEIKLYIQHCTSLMLRNVSWYVTAQALSRPLLKRLDLGAHGRNTSEILAAVTNCYNRMLGLSQLYTEHEGGQIERVYDDVYNSDRSDDEAADMEEKRWLDVGEGKKKTGGQHVMLLCTMILKMAYQKEKKLNSNKWSVHSETFFEFA